MPSAVRHRGPVPRDAGAAAIAALRARAEAIRREEVDRAAGRWERLSEADRRRLESLTTAIVDGVLREPTARASAGTGGARDHLASLRHLFGIDGPAR